jgi:hypothetical protein
MEFICMECSWKEQLGIGKLKLWLTKSLVRTVSKCLSFIFYQLWTHHQLFLISNSILFKDVLCTKLVSKIILTIFHNISLISLSLSYIYFFIKDLPISSDNFEEWIIKGVFLQNEIKKWYSNIIQWIIIIIILNK